MSDDDVEARVLELLLRRFGERYRAQLGANTTMDDVPEWDSMTFLDVVTDVEREFGLRVLPNETAQMFQVGNIVRIVRSKR